MLAQAFVWKQQREQQQQDGPFCRCWLAPRPTNGLWPPSLLGWEPSAIHKFSTMISTKENLVSGPADQGTQTLSPGLSLTYSSWLCLPFVEPVLCTYACKRRYMWKQHLMCWFWDLKVGRCHQATRIEKAEKLRVLFRKCMMSWENNPWAFMQLKNFYSAHQVVFKELSSSSNLLHQ